MMTSYSTRVDATAILKGVCASTSTRALNLEHRRARRITFTSLDPTTLDAPANPLVGFLPPTPTHPTAKATSTTRSSPKWASPRARSNSQASIVFDTNAAIATPQIVNTIDASPPSSRVAALPSTTTTTSFTVSWSGSDGRGPGINNYNVYVSDDGGAYTLWQSDITKTSATYTGHVGHDYDFYSVATDYLGLVQPTPTAPQATISVINTPTPTPTPTPTSTPTPAASLTPVGHSGVVAGGND